MGYVAEVKLNDRTKLYCVPEFIEGDDLSENAYRWCTDEILRYGHVTVRKGKIASISIEYAKYIYKYYDKIMTESGYKKVKS